MNLSLDSTRHLTTLELALRWSMSPRSLERWRMNAEGPPFLRLARKVVYRLADIQEFEQAKLSRGLAEPCR